jgi:hypothetical protein
MRREEVDTAPEAATEAAAAVGAGMLPFSICRFQWSILMHCITLQSLLNRCSIAAQSLFSRFAIAAQSLCNRCSIALQSLLNRFAIAAQSLPLSSLFPLSDL